MFVPMQPSFGSSRKRSFVFSPPLRSSKCTFMISDPLATIWTSVTHPGCQHCSELEKTSTDDPTIQFSRPAFLKTAFAMTLVPLLLAIQLADQGIQSFGAETRFLDFARKFL